MHPKRILQTSSYYPKKGVSVILTIAALLSMVVVFSFRPEGSSITSKKPPFTQKDSIASKKAFLKVYAVLMSPRCMNCHPAGDIPLQGEDSHLHLQGVKRGPDGKGIYALKCANCHQSHNLPGLHMPPGNPKWGLPPANMPMVFQGRSAHQLAGQLLDKKRNGRKSIKALIDHITKDTLVLAGWYPAQGLAKPPLSHREFVKAFNEWISKGAVSP
ncbi:MAG: hypothetical protein V5804_12030 [Mucilaginibacter sp.]|uniref:hypothetical protein n=1 Tax=Mucilaginibacter sp. TaxID=1882438 RepID=UPI0034E4AB37